MKAIYLTIILCFATILCLGQKAPETLALPVKKVKTSERAMLIKNLVINDKSNPFVIINDKKYHWFPNRETAVDYFKKMSLKQDLITVYIDTDKPESTEPDYVIITE